MALYTTQRTHIIWYSNESSSTNSENRKVCERVCERDRYFIITCFDDDCMLNEWLTDWLTDWFVNCATFRHANNLQRQTTHDHKIFISPIFVFNLWAFVCERISARLFALNTYFRFHWNAKKNIVFLAKRAIYDNDMCEIFGFICASMLFRCGRRTHTHREREWLKRWNVTDFKIIIVVIAIITLTFNLILLWEDVHLWSNKATW